MPWVKLEDDWYDNPKLLDLDLPAVGLWVLGLTYCNRYLTDGHIPERALQRLCPGYPADVPGELVERGLWDVVADGWQVHDYLDYQPSAQSVKDQRKRRQEAGRIGGKASGEARSKSSSKSFASRSTPTRPVPTHIPYTSEDLQGEALSMEEQAKKAREAKNHLKAVGE